MNSTKLGWALIAVAAVLMLCTCLGMVSAFNSAAAVDESASAFARGIQSALRPAMVGGPVFLAGAVILIVGWWRGRRLAS